VDDDASSARDRTLRAGAFVFLALAVVAVYGRVYRYEFVAYDDPGYVSDNPFVRAGLTGDGIRWAFTTGHMWNWHPLTWLSHMADVQVFGVAPGSHHLVNVAFHLANTLLLFALLERLTRALWPSLAVAALFAVHPLHVESVAWISERKDVLSGFFFVLTLSAYARYVAARSPRWYAAALAMFGLGLMVKAMLVTVPFVLLLLDRWPLGRMAMPARAAPTAGRRASDPESRRSRRAPSPGRTPTAHDAATIGQHAVPLTTLVAEKIPFFALTLAASVVTYVVQLSQGAMEHSGVLPVGLRVANALVAYVRYLVMMVWPADLAVFYPYDLTLPMWEAAAAGLCLVAISAAVLAVSRRHPYAAVGWLWYIGMLVPVIGLVQVGSQALADRYTYLPLIGIFVVVAWGARDLVLRFAVAPPIVAVGASAAIAAYALAGWAQVGLWQTSETLFAHAARVTRGNYIAHNNLGVALAARGRDDAAIAEYQEALRINPDYDHARSNLAQALIGRDQRALSLHPDDAKAHYRLGRSLVDLGRVPEAIDHYQRAVQLEPGDASVRIELGGALVEAGRLDEAVESYQQGVRLAPDDARAHFNLASALARLDRLPEAIAQYRYVLKLTPDDAEAWGNLAMAHAGLQQTSDAVEAERKAVELARAKGQWALVKTLEDWLSSYQQDLDARPVGSDRPPA
jgi:protein O-mannosyl-transferase